MSDIQILSAQIDRLHGNLVQALARADTAEKRLGEMEWAAEEMAQDLLELGQVHSQVECDAIDEMHSNDALRRHILRMESAGEAVAAALETACRELREKNPRKTIPVLVAWEDAKKVKREKENVQ